MRNNARSAATTVSSHSHQIRFVSLLCLLLCLTLNLQWLSATSVWNPSNILAQGVNLVADYVGSKEDELKAQATAEPS